MNSKYSKYYIFCQPQRYWNGFIRYEPFSPFDIPNPNEWILNENLKYFHGFTPAKVCSIDVWMQGYVVKKAFLLRVLLKPESLTQFIAWTNSYPPQTDCWKLQRGLIPTPSKTHPACTSWIPYVFPAWSWHNPVCKLQGVEIIKGSYPPHIIP